MFATPKALLGAAASITRGVADVGRGATSAAINATKNTMSMAIESATLEYDEAGNAVITMEGDGSEDAAASPPARVQPNYPATPGSALSEPDVAGQLATLLEEREALRRRVEEQKAQIDQRLGEHLQTSEQQQTRLQQQLRAAAEREQDLEQRALQAEVTMQDVPRLP